MVEPAVLILLSLLEGPRHGYAIAADIEEFAAKRLGPGTLYGAIARLVDNGLIVELKAVERRRPFQLTERGRRHLLSQTESMSRLVRTAKSRHIDRPVTEPA